MKLSRSNKRRRQVSAAAGKPDEMRPRVYTRHTLHTRRGQSLVELALVLPLIIVFLSIVIEGGLAINAWIRVNTAARDATRFALDAGLPDQVATLALTKLIGIDFGSSPAITGSGNIDIYEIKGLTDANGNIPVTDTTHWNVNHIYDGDGMGGSPRVTAEAISNRIKEQGDPANIPFVITEVDFNYTPLLGTLISPNTKLPISSYAIIQQQPNN